MNKQEARRYLAAFADGELDVEQNLRVLEQMAMDQANTRRVLHQQQLRRACRQAMDRQEYACPEALRNQIADLARSEPAGLEQGESAQAVSAKTAPHSRQDQVSSSRPAVIARIGQWAPAAAAACLLIVALVSLYIVRDQINRGPRANPPNPAVVSQAQYGEFRGRHQVCSDDVANLFDTVKFPSQLERLPGAIEDYFTAGSGPVPGHLVDSLDLSVLGYRFMKAGACVVPGAGAVHIVYRAAQAEAKDDEPFQRTSSATSSGSAKAISLWVKLDEGKYEIKPGRIYKAGGVDDQPPLLIWKRAGRMYYLIGDVSSDVHKAARMLCEKPLD